MKKIAVIASMALACLSPVPACAQESQAPAPGDNAGNGGSAGDDAQFTGEQAAQATNAPAMAPPPFFGVTGDWGGARTRLYDSGPDLLIAYGTEAAWNARGGARKDATMIGQAIVAANVDMEKLAGIKGGTAKLALFYRHGPSVNITADLGLLQQVQEAYGRGEIVRLVEAWYQQSFDNDRFRVKAGRIPANSDFASFSCDFQNLSFCASPQGNFPGGITYWFSAPGSNWAALARYNLGKSRKNGYFQVGAYQVNQKNIDPTNGFRLGFGGGSGVLIPVETALTPNFGGKRPGSYKIGGWIETSRANDLVKDDQGNLIVLSGRPGDPFRGRHGFYLQVLQQITPSPDGIDRKGLSVFFNFTQLDRKSSLIDNQVAVGFTQTGTFKGRPNDQIAFALARTHVNSRMRVVDRIAVEDGTLPGVRDAEYLAELDYRFIPAAGVRISPNVQWGINPGAISEQRNVVVFGVKSSVQF
jgi:porin